MKVPVLFVCLFLEAALTFCALPLFSASQILKHSRMRCIAAKSATKHCLGLFVTWRLSLKSKL